MQIVSKAMGEYQTNCYIVTIDGKDFIIDAGVGAVPWVLQNVKNPIAIFNTHGHFDHVWSNAELQKKLGTPLYTPAGDVQMLSSSAWISSLPPSKPDVVVMPNEVFDFDGVMVTFHHFAGHTPGCSMIEMGGVFFSGDFIFKGSIGRVDFPLSNPVDMKASLKRFKLFKNDATIYPGHGEKTTIKAEQKLADFWIDAI
ncbi:MAG: MBL fold metallo-hydrolase [Sulfuricurvum sp.]